MAATAAQVEDLTDRTDRIWQRLGQHQNGCRPCDRARLFLDQRCTFGATLYEAAGALSGAIDAVQVIPRGTRVLYIGSLPDAHGEYVCGGRCGCGEGCGRFQYRLLDERGELVLEHVDHRHISEIDEEA